VRSSVPEALLTAVFASFCERTTRTPDGVEQESPRLAHLRGGDAPPVLLDEDAALDEVGVDGVDVFGSRRSVERPEPLDPVDEEFRVVTAEEPERAEGTGVERPAVVEEWADQLLHLGRVKGSQLMPPRVRGELRTDA